MRSKHGFLIVAVVAVLGFANVSFAQLIPISFDDDDFPQITSVFNIGTTNYDANTDLFSVDETIFNAMKLVMGGQIFFITPLLTDPKIVKIRVEVDNLGALVGGVPGEDLIVSGVVDLSSESLGMVSGILLTGEVTAFGSLDAGTSTDEYDFRFTATGGLLVGAGLFFADQDLGVTVQSENSDFTGDFTVSFSGDAKITIGGIVTPAECELQVAKTCCIPPPRSAFGGTDCQGKVIQMVLEYTGDSCAETTNDQSGKAKCTEGTAADLEPVSIEFTGKGHDKLLSTPDTGILVGQQVTFTTTASKFGAGTKLNINAGELFQGLEIHTSCSKPLNVGDQFGSLRLVELTTTEGGTATLPDPNAQPTTACVPAGDPPGTNCDSRPIEVVFEYTGANCQGPLPNPQGGKATCTGDPGGAAPVNVVQTGGKDPSKITVSPTSGILVGDLFNVTATDQAELNSNTVLEISGSGLLQELEIHTSCSEPLRLGDEFGSLRIVEFTTKDGGTFTLPDPGPPPPLTNTCTIQAPPAPPHCTTKAKVLSFRYLGGDCNDTDNFQAGNVVCTDNTLLGPPDLTEPVQFVVSGAGKDTGKIFLDTGSPADVFLGDVVDAVAGAGGKNEFGAESIIQIFDENGFLLEDLSIHTSCSKPLNLGDRFGAVEVFSIDRKDAGLVSLGGVVEYQVTITNPNVGDVDNVTVDDSVLGVIASGLSIPAGETTLFEQALTFVDTRNTVTVTQGTEPDVLLCSEASATVTVEPPPVVPPSCADGKPRQLVFEYTGESCDATTNGQNGKFTCSGSLSGETPVQIVITKDADAVTVSPSLQVVSPMGTMGTLVTFTAIGARLKAETQFDIVQDGTVLQSLTVHTSCSAPLAEGDQFGSMLLRTFVPE